MIQMSISESDHGLRRPFANMEYYLLMESDGGLGLRSGQLKCGMSASKVARDWGHLLHSNLVSKIKRH
jgi:hypothetical protein